MFRLSLLSLLSVASFVPAVLATTISSVDHPAVPVGEKITFTGSGFTGTTGATFIWNRNLTSAAVNVVSDTKLEVTFPSLVQNIRDHHVLVESPSGSALTFGGGAVEFTGTGTIPSTFPSPTQVIARAGPVLQGYPGGVTFVYVESGAVLQISSGSLSNVTVLAESGATLDFRNTTFHPFLPPSILYSTGTTVLGSLPTAAGSSRQIPPLTLHRGVGPFTLGVRLNLSVVGDGSTTVLPNAPFIRHNTNFTVTATPGPGSLFQGWSGSITGTNLEMTASSGTSDKNIVATFTQGYTVETFSGSRGTISASPDLDAYTPGQTIQLSATAAPGYQFVGWGADLAGSVANPLPVTMNSNKIATAVFEPILPATGARVTAVDHPAVPVGETTKLTGSGFTGTTAVNYFWLPYVNSASFTEASDSELQVVFPNVTQNIRDRFLLIESAAGSTVTLGGEVQEITGVTSSLPIPSEAQILVTAGSVLSGLSPTTKVVYVESGAVLQNVPGSSTGCAILAEDGATLDFRGTTFSTSSPPLVIYSPGTTILGSLPAPTGGIFGPAANLPRQVTPLTISRDIGPFTLGVRVNLSVVGNGTATVLPAGPFVRHSTDIILTAVADSGSLFQGWSGAGNSSDAVFTTSSGISDRNIVATFASGYTLSTYAGSWGSITPDPVLETYAPGQQITLLASPLAGYRFVKWGGDLAGSTDNPAAVTMSGNKLVTAVFEPIVPAPRTSITSVDPAAVPVGETLTLGGSGFTGTSAVSFFWRPYVNAATFSAVSDTELEVIFPNVAQPIRERFMLVETPTGSAVTMSGAVTDFTGVGSLNAFGAPLQIVVKAGAVLSGPPSSTRVVHVESGAVLRQVPASSTSCVIFAEDGSTLDLRGVTFSTSSPPLILHGPGTTILGSLPAPANGITGPVVSRQIPSPSLSRDIGPFTEGFELVLTTEGPGTVTVDPVMDFYPRGTSVTLTATPNPGNHFIRWSGGVSSTTNPLTFAIGSSAPVTARFSDRQDFFTGWRQRFFDAEELADPDISGLDADPDGDQITNAGEYAFGSNPTVAGAGKGIKVLPGGNPHRDGNLRLVYDRPVLAADIDYILQASKGTSAWSDGSSGEITFEVIEESAVPQGADMEKITLLLNFTAEVPKSFFFRLTANIEDLP